MKDYVYTYKTANAIDVIRGGISSLCTTKFNCTLSSQSMKKGIR